MLKRICFLFFLLTPVIFLCQAPGYMGKKTTLGGGVYINPMLFGSTANNKALVGNADGSAETGHFRLNCTYSVFAERVMSTRWLFGTSVNYIRTGYDNRASISTEGNPTGHYKINAFSINPYFKHYKRRAPAPLGRYFLIGPSVNIISTKHDNYMHFVRTTNGHDTLMTDFGAKKQMHFTGDLIIGWGKTRIINDKILLDYGFNFGVISVIHIFEASDAQLNNSITNKTEYIELTSISRLRNATRFNLFFRVAYLL